MIIDTSAVVAVLRDEPERPAFLRAIEVAESCRMSVVNYVEAFMVLNASQSTLLGRRLDELVEDASIELVPVSEKQARIACSAFRDFGRGSGNKAKLNFGDCFAYALSKDTREPLLFKGKDFLHTDLKSAT